MCSKCETPLFKALSKELLPVVLKERKKLWRWNRYIEMTQKMEAKIFSFVVRYFRAQRRVFLKRAEKQFVWKKTDVAASFWRFYNRSDWDERFRSEGLPFLRELYYEFGVDAIRELEKRVGPIGINFTEYNDYIEPFVEDYTIRLATVINDTTETALRGSVMEGIKLGESMPQIRDRIKTVFDQAENYRAMVIARTETIRASNQGARLGYQESGVVTEVEWLTAFDERTCPFCAYMDGKRASVDGLFFKKGATLDVEGQRLVFGYEEISAPPLHPNCRCFADGQVVVYTSKGWKQIQHIIVGDLVLTHNGRFRKVTELIRTPKQKPAMTTIWLKTSGGSYRTKLSLTSNHHILLNGSWQEAGLAKAGDSVNYLTLENCKWCSDPVPSYFERGICSCSCNSKLITQRQWSDPEHRLLISQKISKKNKEQYANGDRDRYKQTEKAHVAIKRMAEEGRHPYQQEENKEKFRKRTNSKEQRFRASLRMKADNPSFDPEVRQRMTESYKKTILAFPDRHPNRIMAQKGFISSLEKRMMHILDALDLNYEHQFPVLNFFVDFALKDLKVAIEVDGRYWHDKDPEKDLLRQKKIEEEGWTVVRFDNNDLKKESLVKEELQRIVSNHSGEYGFMQVEVVKVEHWIPKKAKMLYNLSVEEDESYVAKGFVVHNCTLVPIVDESVFE